MKLPRLPITCKVPPRLSGIEHEITLSIKQLPPDPYGTPLAEKYEARASLIFDISFERKPQEYAKKLTSAMVDCLIAHVDSRIIMDKLQQYKRARRRKIKLI